MLSPALKNIILPAIALITFGTNLLIVAWLVFSRYDGLSPDPYALGLAVVIGGYLTALALTYSHLGDPARHSYSALHCFISLMFWQLLVLMGAGVVFGAVHNTLTYLTGPAVNPAQVGLVFAGLLFVGMFFRALYLTNQPHKLPEAEDG